MHNGMGDARSRSGAWVISTGKPLALITLCLAQFGVVLAFQGSAINLPEIERELGLSATISQWLISVNALTFGGLLLLAGRAADLFGRRRLFIAGTALFGMASVMAGLAPGAGWLIVARALQGAGAALFTPAMIALLADIFPEGPERRRALAWWGAAGPAGGVIAILLGGALASAFGWRAVFLLSAPLALPIVALARVCFPATAPRRSKGLNPVSAVAGALGVAALVYGLSLLANDSLLTLRATGGLVIGCALILGFIWFERRAADPLIPRPLLGRRVAWLAIGTAFFHAASTNTPIVFYSLFMQQFRQASPWEIGIGFLPCNFAIMAASPGAARLARRYGFRLVMAAGMAVVVAGLLVLTTITPDAGYLTTFLPGWFLLGLGLGAAQVGVVGTATESVAADERGVAGGLVNTAAQIGTAVGLALLVTVSQRVSGEIAGYRAAFSAGALLAVAGLLLALVSPRRRDMTQPANGRGAAIQLHARAVSRACRASSSSPPGRR